MSINDNITGFAPAGQITPDPENTIDAPNTLTPDASTPIGTPDTVTPVGAGSITAPNTINPDAVNDVGAPNTLTPDAVNNVDAPNTLAPDAVNPIATPVGFAPLNSEPINRVLTPLIGLNFSSQNYSVMGQPSTFDNALTYSRASSATYVETYRGPLGRFQKRITTDYVGSVTNLALYSEDLDNTAWLKSGSLIQKSNSSFLGSNIFTLIEDTSTSNNHGISDGITVGVGDVTVSIFAKAKERGFIQILNTGSPFENAIFDLNNGVVASQSNSIATIKYISDGWYKCSMTYSEASAGSSTFSFIMFPLSGAPSYTGDGKSGIFLTRVSATNSAKPLPYVRTFDSAVTETFTANPRFEDEGLLVEGASTNICTFSELLNASGGYSATGTTSSINSGIAPDGSNSALQLNEDTSNGVHRIFKSLTVASGVKYTVSIYAKSISQTFLALPENVTGGTSAGVTYFNLTNGEISASLVDVSIENVGNGWFRCSKTYTTTATAFAPQFMLSNGSNTSYLGESKSILIWGAQVEALQGASSYIRTESAAVSRSLDVAVQPFNISRGNISVKAQSLFGITAAQNYVATLFSSNVNNSINITDVNGVVQVFIRNPSGNTFLATGTLDNEWIDGVEVSLNFAPNDCTVFIGEESPVNDQTVIIPIVATLSIGSIAQSSPFYGHIEYVKVFDTALTANEVKSL